MPANALHRRVAAIEGLPTLRLARNQGTEPVALTDTDAGLHSPGGSATS